MDTFAHPIVSNKDPHFNFQVFTSSHKGPTYIAERKRKLMLWAYIKKKKKQLKHLFSKQENAVRFSLSLYKHLRFPYFNYSPCSRPSLMLWGSEKTKEKKMNNRNWFKQFLFSWILITKKWFSGPFNISV